MFFKIGVLKNFANFTGKHLCWSLFLINLQAFRSATLLKKDFNTSVILWNLQNISELFFSQNTFIQCLLLCVLKIWRKFQSRIINKSHIGRQQLYCSCRLSRGNFSKQYPQLFLLLSWALWKFELYNIYSVLWIINSFINDDALLSFHYV